MSYVRVPDCWWSMTLPPSNERNGYRTGFCAASDRGSGWACSPLMSEPNGVPKKKRELRLARASRHSSENR